MSEQQLNYQFNNYSRIITYQQDVLESVIHNREIPSLSTINIDDNNLQDKIKVGDTSLIYALRLWPATREIIWSLLQKNINIKPKSYQVWSYQPDQVNNIICKTIEEIPNVQIPIQIVWKNWKYYKITKMGYCLQIQSNPSNYTSGKYYLSSWKNWCHYSGCHFKTS